VELSGWLVVGSGHTSCGEAAGVEHAVGPHGVVDLDGERSGAYIEGFGHPELVVPSGHCLVHADDSALSPRVARSRLMGFRGRYMERFRVVRSFDEARDGDSTDHAGRATGAPGSRVLFDAGWSYRRRPNFSLGRAVGRGAPPDR
jgi:hypothetical protein